MLFDFTSHNFSVKGNRLFLSDLVGKLSILWLDYDYFINTHNVGDAVFFFVCPELRLLGQERFVLEGTIDLLSESTSRRYVLRGFLVKLSHLVVKLINLGFIRYFVCSISGRHKAFGGAVIFFCRSRRTVFKLFDLSLNFGHFLYKLFVPKQLGAQADTELFRKTEIYRI